MLLVSTPHSVDKSVPLSRVGVTEILDVVLIKFRLGICYQARDLCLKLVILFLVTTGVCPLSVAIKILICGVNHGLSEGWTQTVFKGIASFIAFLIMELKASTLSSTSSAESTSSYSSWLSFSYRALRLAGFIPLTCLTSGGIFCLILWVNSRHWWSDLPLGGRCWASWYSSDIFVTVI